MQHFIYFLITNHITKQKKFFFLCFESQFKDTLLCNLSVKCSLRKLNQNKIKMLLSVFQIWFLFKMIKWQMFWKRRPKSSCSLFCILSKEFSIEFASNIQVVVDSSFFRFKKIIFLFEFNIRNVLFRDICTLKATGVGNFFYPPSSSISSCVRTADMVMCLHTWHSPAM